MTRPALPPKILRGLDFGAPAAERDIGRGLEKYFVESAAYQRVRSGAKTIILGNRGSGKSAIFKVLASRERSSGSRVIELAPEDYQIQHLNLAAVQSFGVHPMFHSYLGVKQEARR